MDILLQIFQPAAYEALLSLRERRRAIQRLESGDKPRRSPDAASIEAHPVPTFRVVVPSTDLPTRRTTAPRPLTRTA